MTLGVAETLLRVSRSMEPSVDMFILVLNSSMGLQKVGKSGKID